MRNSSFLWAGLCLILFSLLSSCRPRENTANKLRLLSYSSLLGKNSLGEHIISVYNSTCDTKMSSPCSLEIIPEDGVSNLGSLFIKNKSFDGVLGLDRWQSLEVKKHRSTQDSFMFSYSPHAIMVNHKQWPSKTPLPKTWKELAQHKNLLILQDPAVSVVGMGWIKALKEHQLLEIKEAKALVHKTFPSWSSAYSAFTEGLAPLVWSYQTSEAYHICSQDKVDQFKILSLEEGYPMQEEWVLISKELTTAQAQFLREVLLSKAIQDKIAEKNYMLPALDQALVPDCFKLMTPIKTLTSDENSLAHEKSRSWLDEWSL